MRGKTGSELPPCRSDLQRSFGSGGMHPMPLIGGQRDVEVLWRTFWRSCWPWPPSWCGQGAAGGAAGNQGRRARRVRRADCPARQLADTRSRLVAALLSVHQPAASRSSSFAVAQTGHSDRKLSRMSRSCHFDDVQPTRVGLVQRRELLRAGMLGLVEPHSSTEEVSVRPGAADGRHRAGESVLQQRDRVNGTASWQRPRYNCRRPEAMVIRAPSQPDRLARSDR